MSLIDSLGYQDVVLLESLFHYTYYNTIIRCPQESHGIISSSYYIHIKHINFNLVTSHKTYIWYPSLCLRVNHSIMKAIKSLKQFCTILLLISLKRQESLVSEARHPCLGEIANREYHEFLLKLTHLV